MTRQYRSALLATACLMPLASLVPSAVLAAPHAHEHGAVKLEVTIEGANLTVGVESPLDSLIGFERAPKNAKERQAAADLLARMRDGKGLFAADAGANCTLAKTEVEAPVLEPGAKPSKDEHADLDATYEYKCEQPQQLRALDVGLFEAFKRIQRIEVQVAGPGGQLKSTLKRPARSVPLAR